VEGAGRIVLIHVDQLLVEDPINQSLIDDP
jgi:hypothetical protein